MDHIRAFVDFFGKLTSHMAVAGLSTILIWCAALLDRTVLHDCDTVRKAKGLVESHG